MRIGRGDTCARRRRARIRDAGSAHSFRLLDISLLLLFVGARVVRVVRPGLWEDEIFSLAMTDPRDTAPLAVGRTIGGLHTAWIASLLFIVSPVSISSRLKVGCTLSSGFLGSLFAWLTLTLARRGDVVVRVGARG